MPSVFRPTLPADVDELGSFLRRILAPTGPGPGFESTHLTWKYWSPLGAGDGARSFVLTGDLGIEAHCGVLPTWLRSVHGRIRTAHFIDWAADPRTMAAGVQLLRKVGRLTESLCAVGGTPATRKILPLMGFRPANQAVFFARPVRPVRQAATHQQRDWKLPLRLIRNALWARFPTIKLPDGWTFELVTPDFVPTELWFPPTPSWAARERGPALYSHYLACPFVRFELFLFRFREQPVGGCLLGFASGQARVADLWLVKESADWFEAAYQAALAASLTDPTIAEVIACASIDPRLNALGQCGFREYRRESILVLPADRAPRDGFDCQLLDNDTAFLTLGSPEYVT